MKKFALVGKPNAGKSSLFNLLSGLNQKIGNYSGVTVEKKKGIFLQYEVVDLPGIKSLRSGTPEERISKQTILQYAEEGLPLMFVANGMQLEDNLLLFTEIADLQVPMILVINFKDDLEKNQIEIDAAKLADELGCHVVMMNSRNGDGIEHLKMLVSAGKFYPPNAVCRSLYDRFENDDFVNNYASTVRDARLNENSIHKEDFFKRQKIIAKIVRSTIHEVQKRDTFLARSLRWDKVLLHPFLGVLFFLATLLVVFQSVFYLSGIPMEWIDSGFSAASAWVNDNVQTEWLASLISDGILAGLGGVLIFIPQIAILFFLLGILEHSGYLSRISFISNRALSAFGLSGQSIIPLMSSWACAIPAIMSARVINNPKERMAVILASPLMTCSARLPVYTILIAIMFPEPTPSFFNVQGLLLLSLYLLGVIATLLVAKFVHNRTKIEASPLWSLELPIYRIPNWRNVLFNVYYKTKAFVVDAGKVIFIVSIALWVLASFSPKSQSFIDTQYQSLLDQSTEESTITREAVALEYSFAGYLGKSIEPVIEPLGYDWKIGIALITSFAAREVFVGSLATIYSVGSDEESKIQTRLRNEVNEKTGLPRYSLATCISLLLFYVFALQCMSTMAIVRKETGTWSYPMLQFFGMLALAYIAAFAGYQLF